MPSAKYSAAPVPAKDIADNDSMSEVIGNKTDGHNGSSAMALLHTLEEHEHKPQFVYPDEANSINVATSGVAWDIAGASYTTIIPDGVITDDFDIHWVVLSNPSANAQYQINIYCDDAIGGPIIFCGSVAFTRITNQVRSFAEPIMMPIAPAGYRVRAKLACSLASVEDVDVKLAYHEY